MTDAFPHIFEPNIRKHPCFYFLEFRPYYNPHTFEIYECGPHETLHVGFMVTHTLPDGQPENFHIEVQIKTRRYERTHHRIAIRAYDASLDNFLFVFTETLDNLDNVNHGVDTVFEELVEISRSKETMVNWIKEGF